MDLSYVLNTAYRISVGDIPYKDFFQPHPPLTFLIQAAIVKLFDSSVLHHIWYAAIVSGLATVLTAEILGLLFGSASLRHGRLSALFACLPLIPLGIYSLYPHPWYDADACFFSLAALYSLLRARDATSSTVWPALSGALLVLPVFTKQNMGLALFAATHLTALPWAFDRLRRRSYGLLLGASAGTLALALGALHATCGIAEYVRWTFTFAAQRRLALALPFEMYRDTSVWMWTSIAGLGALLAARRSAPRWTRWGGAFLLLAPVPLPLLFDNWTRVFFRLWPLTILLAGGLALVRWVRDRELFHLLFAGTIIAFCHASFLAQGVGGSSFAIWPFFCLVTACNVVGLKSLAPTLAPTLGELYLAGVVLTVLLTGVPVLASNLRLEYIHTAGPVRAARHPRLRGLHVSGDYLPRLEELLWFFESDVPADQGILEVHGEDPLYFALRRRPRLPVVLFDTTQDIYTPQELVDRALASGVDWLVIKKKRQIRQRPPAGLERVAPLALEHYEPVLDNDTYLVLRRRRPS